MQFDKCDSMFLLNKCHTTSTGTKFHIATSGVTSSVASECFMGLLLKTSCPKWKCMVWSSLKELWSFQIWKMTSIVTSKGCERSIHTLGRCEYEKN